MTEITLKELRERLEERIQNYERSLEQLKARINQVAGALAEARAMLAELDEEEVEEQDENDA